MSISDNIYSAGWTLEQFHESIAYIGGVDYPFPEYIDAQTGELINSSKARDGQPHGEESAHRRRDGQRRTFKRWSE